MQSETHLDEVSGGQPGPYLLPIPCIGGDEAANGNDTSLHHQLANLTCSADILFSVFSAEACRKHLV